MKKAELVEFLDSWNQLDKAEGDYKPINPYQLHAIFVSPNFFLKWYLLPGPFNDLAKELEYEFDPGNENKIIFMYSDQRVEIEKLVDIGEPELRLIG
ncbi:hypothetical protein IDJ77_22275 [Mucilaginibacter sp. ZT4R22]|uniref:Uncharacterized protein n=1 Tax=Mucilaginibacter pankratovii TaxID=2772110 RepID=A0ABR7WZ76_9SPHI|nr:hypothetical protein [Mucilaginibacter pankratovii]MBD1366557.1 hypothetical protein [Mucilaginibacter pankratovii]